ncbi:MAG: hypothetical protein AVDCRST_MAG12-1115, partial [uncultured Rubrobacteraceae bacterium]
WRASTTSSPATNTTARPSCPATRPRSPAPTSATGAPCCPPSGSNSPRARSSPKPRTSGSTPAGSRRTYRG